METFNIKNQNLSKKSQTTTKNTHIQKFQPITK